MPLIHFDAETVEEINAELEGRNIEIMNVVNVESGVKVVTDIEHADKPIKTTAFRVWYWYVSELIT